MRWKSDSISFISKYKRGYALDSGRIIENGLRAMEYDMRLGKKADDIRKEKEC